MREGDELLCVETQDPGGVNGAGQSLSKEHPTGNRAARKMHGNHSISCSLFSGVICFELERGESTDSSQREPDHSHPGLQYT